MTFWLAMKAGFGFLSTIPVGITMEGIDALMKKLYMYAIVGSILGLIIGIFGAVTEVIFPTPLTVILIMGFIYYIIWFNHLDGVADMGDGMTAHGTVEKKRKALKDMAVGVGGVASVVLVMLALYAALITLEGAAIQIGNDFKDLNFYSNWYMTGPLTGFIFEFIYNSAAYESVTYNSAAYNSFSPKLIAAAIIGLALLVSETNAKQSMITIATFGKSFQEGLGAMTIRGGTFKNMAIGTVYSLLTAFLFLGFTGVAATLLSILSALVILKISNKHFEGLNGDGIGVSNEIGRIVSIVSIAVIYNILYKIALNGGFSWTL